MEAIDLQMTHRFVHCLAREGSLTFQTYPESNTAGDGLARILHGSLDEHSPVLTDLNKRGAGVFLTVNETDGKGRKAENIIRVRALVVDLDGAPLDPVMNHPIPPSMVVETSPAHWHAYWLTDDCDTKDFKVAQQRLARQFNGDLAVCDLPRVMRLPGFLHQKGEPFMTRIIFPS